MPDDYVFEGFDSPSYTQVPDAVFDVLMPHLSGAEFKVLLYIVRRTFGFKKLADDISLQQITSGIKTKSGKQLDGGTGLSRDSVTKAVKRLEERRIIVRNRRYSDEKGDQPSTYSLHFKHGVSEITTPGESDFRTPPPREIGHPPVRESDPQQTERQQTEKDSSKGHISGSDRTVIEAMITDFARELRDQAPLDSSVGRAVNLYADSGLDLDGFLATLQEARAATQKHSGGIRAEVDDGSGRKSKMAYFFSVLEDLISRAA